MKQGKEIKLNNYENYRIKIGTVNTKQPKSIYINISAWGDPKQSEVVDYKKVLNNLSRSIKSNVGENIKDTIFNNIMYFVDLDMRESGIKYGKKSLLHCEITLYQNTYLEFDSNEIQSGAENIINKLISDVFNNDNYFDFRISKTTTI